MQHARVTDLVIRRCAAHSSGYARVADLVIRRRAAHSSGYARVAELVDALASGVSVSNDVEVQVLSRAPKN